MIKQMSGCVCVLMWVCPGPPPRPSLWTLKSFLSSTRGHQVLLFTTSLHLHSFTLALASKTGITRAKSDLSRNAYHFQRKTTSGSRQQRNHSDGKKILKKTSGNVRSSEQNQKWQHMIGIIDIWSWSEMQYAHAHGKTHTHANKFKFTNTWGWTCAFTHTHLLQ